MMMKRTAVALLAFTGMGLVSFGVSSFAQQAGQRGEGQPPARGGYDERADRFAERHGFDHMLRMSPEDRAAFLDAHIAAVHAGLKLSAEQEKLWAPAEQAFREGMTKIAAQADEWRKSAKTDDALAALRRRAEGMALHADTMRKVADAAQPLYASLTAEQKHRLPLLLHGHHGMMERARDWMRDHWRQRGDEDQQRPPR
jgi:LTXXQ motif family protein